jgi:hypothetical protein
MSARLLAIAALAGLLAGCGGSGDDSPPPNASAELEALISRQLPAKVRRVVGPTAYVTGVHCIHRAASDYECIASVSGTNAYSGQPERTQVPISATCDRRACIWKLSP